MWQVWVKREFHTELWWKDVKERGTLKYPFVDLKETEWKVLIWISLGPDRDKSVFFCKCELRLHVLPHI